MSPPLTVPAVIFAQLASMISSCHLAQPSRDPASRVTQPLVVTPPLLPIRVQKLTILVKTILQIAEMGALS